MHAYIALIPLIYLLAAVPYAGLGLYAWIRRPSVAGTPFAWMMLGMAIWSFFYSLEILFPDLQTKLRLENLVYIGVVSLPVFFLMFALEFSGRGHLLTPRNKLLLWIFPLFILFLVTTNNLHNLMWDSETVEESFGLLLLKVRPQFFYWVNVSYSYILLLIGSLLFIKEIIQRPGIYRFQASLVIIGLLLPWFQNVITLTRLSPIRNLDLTVLFFIPTSIALGWAITRYRLLDVIPPEHVAILRNMREGVIVVDARQRILYLNPIAELLIGRKESEIVGQPLTHISGVLVDTLASNLTGDEHQFEISLGKGRNTSVYDVSVSPMSSQKYPASQDLNHVIILRDITLRKETEAILSLREAIMEAINLAAEQFLKESSWEHNIPGILEKLGKAADVSRVYVVMNYSDEEGKIYSSLCYEWVAEGIPSLINNPAMQHISLRDAGLGRWEETMGKGQSLYGLLRTFPESERNLFKDQPMLSIAMIPIFVEKKWWGFIGFDECRYERVWKGAELDALHTAANIFGSAETRTRAEQKLLRRQRTLNMLHEIVVLSLKATNLESMAAELVNRMGELLKANGCFMPLWDESYSKVVPLAAYGSDKEKYLMSPPASDERTLTASVLKSGVPLILEDVQNSEYKHYNFIESFQSKSLVVFPLIAGSNRLGAIILTYNNHHRFQSEEIAIGEQAVSLIALSLEKFQAVEHAHRRAEKSETLRKAGTVVTETLQTEEVVARILDQLAKVVPYDTASIQMLDGNEVKIVGGHGWGTEKRIVGVRYPVPGNNPNTVVIQTGKSYFVPDVSKKYATFNNPFGDHIRSWLGIPLIVQGRIIGLLAIHSSKPDHFKKEDIELATAFADQVAVNLENTRLFEEAQGLALIDSLTGLYNRRGLFELGKVEFARATRSDRPFSGIMIDLDHFKDVNDTYGHPIGDQVLCEVARRVKRCIREIDFVGRYGGEEIIILLPETNMNAALHVAERLRIAIGNRPILAEGGTELSITASLGVANRDDNTTTLETLIARADQAMYIAKHKGRNRVAKSV